MGQEVNSLDIKRKICKSDKSFFSFLYLRSCHFDLGLRSLDHWGEISLNFILHKTQNECQVWNEFENAVLKHLTLFCNYAFWQSRRVKAKNAITLELKLYSYTKLTIQFMSFRNGDKVVVRNPKPCSIRTTTLIKSFYLSLAKYLSLMGENNTRFACGVVAKGCPLKRFLCYLIIFSNILLFIFLRKSLTI